MPTYDYRCEATQEVYEVQHPMSERLTTWGELCAILEQSTGEISPQSAVTRLIRGGGVVKSSALKNPEAPPCYNGTCSGGCGASL